MAKVSTFANRLKEIMSIRSVSQAELARLSGISPSNISRYVKGDWEGKQDAVYKIAKAINCTEAWLMGYDVPMEYDSTQCGHTIVQAKQSSYASKLKRAREKANFSIEDIAKTLKLNREVIEKFENEHIDFKMGNRIFEDMCRLYHVTPYEILDNYDPEAAPSDADMKFVLFGCSNAPDSLLDKTKEYALFLFEQHKKENRYSE